MLCHQTLSDLQGPWGWGQKTPNPSPLAPHPLHPEPCVFSAHSPLHRPLFIAALLGSCSHRLFWRLNCAIGGVGLSPGGARAPKQLAGLAQGWIPLGRRGVLVMSWLGDSPSSSSSSFLFLLILLLGIPAGISCVVIAAVQPPKLHTAAGQGGKGTSPCPCARSQGCVAPWCAGQPVLALVRPWLLSPSHQGLTVPRAWHIMAEYSGVLVIWAPALSVPAWPIPCAHGDIFAC